MQFHTEYCNFIQNMYAISYGILQFHTEYVCNFLHNSAISYRICMQFHTEYLCNFRDLKTKSFDWFYKNVSEKFKRFGSAKVVRSLYKHADVGHSKYHCKIL